MHCGRIQIGALQHSNAHQVDHNHIGFSALLAGKKYRKATVPLELQLFGIGAHEHLSFD